MTKRKATTSTTPSRKQKTGNSQSTNNSRKRKNTDQSLTSTKRKTKRSSTSNSIDVFSLCRPDEVELDLRNFSLSKSTHEFFGQIAGLLKCKKSLDRMYKKSCSRVLKKARYKSYGSKPKPRQEGPSIMTVKQVRREAKAKKELFEELLESVVRKLGMNPEKIILVDGEPIEKEWGCYKVLTLVPLKSRARSKEKTRDDYDGNAKFLCDVARATIVCSTEEEIARVIDQLQEKSDVVRLKNRFAKPTYTGVRDILMNIRLKGYVFELQIHRADLLAIDLRSHGHDFYEYFRKYFVGTTESYQKRAATFHRLGEDVLEGDITEAIRSILKGKDRTKLQNLAKITGHEMFVDHDLNLKAHKRLLSLVLEDRTEKDKCLTGLHNIAIAYNSQGGYDKSLEWYHKTLEGREAIYGKNHPCTLATVNNMALVYSRQDNYEKAQEWFQRALEGRELAQGKDHQSTLNTVHNMANLYKDQGEYEKALEFYQRALDGRKTGRGEDHPNTLSTVNNMALVHSHQGKYEKALEGFKAALHGREAKLGKEHPTTLATVHNMAGLYVDQGQYNMAREWYQRALEGREAVLGKDHPATLVTKSDINRLHSIQWNKRMRIIAVMFALCVCLLLFMHLRGNEELARWEILRSNYRRLDLDSSWNWASGKSETFRIPNNNSRRRTAFLSFFRTAPSSSADGRTLIARALSGQFWKHKQ